MTYFCVIRNATASGEAKLPEIQAELKAAGIETVQAEAQRQLDEYLASGK